MEKRDYELYGDFEDEVALAAVMDERGYMDHYQEIIDSGRGPKYPWMRALDARLQLWQEDVETRMDEETRARFLYWLEQKENQDERRLCQAFMQGVWYEREHPGVWEF